MACPIKLKTDIETIRCELKNIRQELFKQKANMKVQATQIKSLLTGTKEESWLIEETDGRLVELPAEDETVYSDQNLDSLGTKIDCISNVAVEEQNLQMTGNLMYSMSPIGFISSCFKFKNGIPRQPSLCPTAKGSLKIEKSVFTNPEHSLIGLEEFSHIWILFIFHKNENNAIKAKIHPPRLNGASVGVFSTRSPHRPSALGLSLVKLDRIEGDTLFLSGIDLLDGTPVLDIKPYIPLYDNPLHFREIKEVKLSEENNQLEAKVCPKEASNSTEVLNSKEDEYLKNTSADYKVPEFLRETEQNLSVVFTNRALADLETICAPSNSTLNFQECQERVLHIEEAKQIIVEVLQNDPRSVYRRNKCSDKLYYFYINNLHVTCWFDDSVAEVLRIKIKEATM